ncbi:DUF1365 family protein [Epibacterium sp. SM1969]|uniref:DUF1365 family protein n=1 Tax=Tritonibacter aquimaris TaxID=2663379 RepID=A0A844AZ78_9RHOB|nr:DUF1365 domain-containing protein [Tritonibacter aquimaris]MQY43241.1 DUF1365 family protein [Tritonibacter aquimaris]
MFELLECKTFHARRGGPTNAFTYGVDYVLCDLNAPSGLRLLSRNRFNLWSIWDHRHGGPRGSGSGLAWFKQELATRGFPYQDAQLLLMTQPSFLWFHFNPVSFWLALVDGVPRAIIAEVNNTFGHRHCYFCARPGFAPITKDQTIVAEKLMHVSPFQTVAGRYVFTFDFTQRAVNIRILYENGKHGVLATLVGERHAARDHRLAWAAMRRPLGAARVMALIHWQALKLWVKRAPFLRKQPPPEPLISDSVSPPHEPGA